MTVGKKVYAFSNHSSVHTPLYFQAVDKNWRKKVRIFPFQPCTTSAAFYFVSPVMCICISELFQRKDVWWEREEVFIVKIKQEKVLQKQKKDERIGDKDALLFLWNEHLIWKHFFRRVQRKSWSFPSFPLLPGSLANYKKSVDLII